jgi:serine/threonine protein kinase
MNDDMAAMQEMTAVMASLQASAEYHEMASSHIQDYVAPPSDRQKITAMLKKTPGLEMIPGSSVTVMAPIGSGGYGQVYSALHRQRGGGPAKLVAAKTVEEGPGLSELLLQEAAIRVQFKHPNVVAMLGVVEESIETGRPLVLLEQMELGSLDRFLRRTRPALPAKLRISAQIASAVEYLSDCSFVMCGLSARNIYVGDGYVCKVSVPRLARGSDPADPVFRVHKLNVRWSPPDLLSEGDALDAFEGKTGDSGMGGLNKKLSKRPSDNNLLDLANGRVYSTASDMWSFGVVLWEVFSSADHIPYAKWSNSKVIKQVKRGHRLAPPANCPRDVYSLMMHCWHPDPDARLTPAELSERLPETDQELGCDVNTACEDLQNMWVGTKQRKGSRRSAKSGRSRASSTLDAPTVPTVQEVPVPAASAITSNSQISISINSNVSEAGDSPRSSLAVDDAITAVVVVPPPGAAGMFADAAGVVAVVSLVDATVAALIHPAAADQNTVIAITNESRPSSQEVTNPTDALPTPPDSPLIHRSLLELKPEKEGTAASSSAGGGGGKRNRSDPGYNTGTGSSRPSMSYASTGTGSSGRLSRSFLFDQDEAGATRSYSDSPHSSLSKRTGRSYTQRNKPRLKPASDKTRPTASQSLFRQPDKEVDPLADPLRPISTFTFGSRTESDESNSPRNMKHMSWLSTSDTQRMSDSDAAHVVMMAAAEAGGEALRNEHDSYIEIEPDDGITWEPPAVHTRLVEDEVGSSSEDEVNVDQEEDPMLEDAILRSGAESKSAMALAMEGAKVTPPAATAPALIISTGPRVAALTAVVAPPRSPQSLKHRMPGTATTTATTSARKAEPLATTPGSHDDEALGPLAPVPLLSPRSRSNTVGSTASLGARSSWPARKAAPEPKRWSAGTFGTNRELNQMDPAEAAPPGTELPLLAQHGKDTKSIGGFSGSPPASTAALHYQQLPQSPTRAGRPLSIERYASERTRAGRFRRNDVASTHSTYSGQSSNQLVAATGGAVSLPLEMEMPLSPAPGSLPGRGFEPVLRTVNSTVRAGSSRRGSGSSSIGAERAHSDPVEERGSAAAAAAGRGSSRAGSKYGYAAWVAKGAPGM